MTPPQITTHEIVVEEARISMCQIRRELILPDLVVAVELRLDFVTQTARDGNDAICVVDTLLLDCTHALQGYDQQGERLSHLVEHVDVCARAPKQQTVCDRSRMRMGDVREKAMASQRYCLRNVGSRNVHTLCYAWSRCTYGLPASSAQVPLRPANRGSARCRTARSCSSPSPSCTIPSCCLLSRHRMRRECLERGCIVITVNVHLGRGGESIGNVQDARHVDDRTHTVYKTSDVNGGHQAWEPCLACANTVYSHMPSHSDTKSATRSMGTR
jgi:hypothetical protein